MNRSNPNNFGAACTDQNARMGASRGYLMHDGQRSFSQQGHPLPQQSVQGGWPLAPQPPSYGPGPSMPGRSGLAVAGMVLGIVALLTSFMPIVNNLSFLMAIIGLVLATVGIWQVRKGKRSGGGMAIAGIIMNVLAVVLVLAFQAYYSSALEEVFDSTSVSRSASASGAASGSAASTSSAASSSSASAASAQDFQDLPIGTAVELTNGLSVSVESVTSGLLNYDDSPVTQVTVSYRNDGTRNVSFGPYDWKGQDPQGAQRSITYYSNAENGLSSGDLAPGGAVTGNLYFDGALSRVVFQTSLFSKSNDATWSVS